MNITFVNKGRENIGIEYLSSCIKKMTNHRVNLIHKSDYIIENSKVLDNEYNILVEQIIDTFPDLIAFSVYSDNVNFFLEISKRIKSKKNIPILCGGVHITATESFLLNYNEIDYLMISECENSIIDFLKFLENNIDIKNVNNLIYRNKGKIKKNKIAPLINNLDSIPFPDKELFSNNKIDFYKFFILSGRGCPFSCSYCMNNMYKNINNYENYLRRRSVDNVIAEIEFFLMSYDIKYIAFLDDVFIFNEKWLEEFTEKYKKKINIPYFCLINPNVVNEKKVILLKESGCDKVEIGVQTADEEIRKKYLNRKESNEKINITIEYLKKYKLKFSLDRILGMPFENKKTQNKNLFFFNKWNPNEINIFYLTLYPGTEIIKYLLENKIISTNDVDKIYKGNYSENFFIGGSIINNEYDLKIWRTQHFYYLLISLLPKYISYLILQIVTRKPFNKIIINSKYLIKIMIVLTQIKLMDTINIKIIFYLVFNKIYSFFKNIFRIK